MPIKSFGCYIYINNPNINMNRCILIWPVQTHPFLHIYIYIYIYASLLSSVLVIYFVSNHSTSRAFRAHSSQILPNPLWNLPSQHFTNCIWQEEGSLLTIICTYIYYIYIYTSWKQEAVQPRSSNFDTAKVWRIALLQRIISTLQTSFFRGFLQGMLT